MTPSNATNQRSSLDTVALALSAISLIGFVCTLITIAVNGNGGNQNNGTFSKIVFLTYAIGAVAALVIGIAAWIRGRRRGAAKEIRAGQIAVGYFVLAFVIFAIASVIG